MVGVPARAFSRHSRSREWLESGLSRYVRMTGHAVAHTRPTLEGSGARLDYEISRPLSALELLRAEGLHGIVRLLEDNQMVPASSRRTQAKPSVLLAYKMRAETEKERQIANVPPAAREETGMATMLRFWPELEPDAALLRKAQKACPSAFTAPVHVPVIGVLSVAQIVLGPCASPSPRGCARSAWLGTRLLLPPAVTPPRS